VDASIVKDFVFDRTVADHFDDMVRRSVPHYNELQRMTVEMASHFAQEGSEVVDIGCSTGRTLEMLLAEFSNRDIRLLGVDNSPAMLEKAASRLSSADAEGRCRLLCADANDGLPSSDPSVVIMNWTLQFVRPLSRDAVIRDIHDKLRPGGCLILMEKVLCPESLLNRLYIDFYYEFKKREGYSASEIASKRESLENILVPYRVEENSTLLKRNGFGIVDVFFRWYNWAGFIAVKCPSATHGA